MSVSLLRSQVYCGDGTLFHHLGFGQCLFLFFFFGFLGGEFSIKTKNKILRKNILLKILCYFEKISKNLIKKIANNYCNCLQLW